MAWHHPRFGDANAIWRIETEMEMKNIKRMGMLLGCAACMATANPVWAQTPTAAQGEVTVHVSSQKMALAVLPLNASGNDTLLSQVDAVLSHTLTLTGLFQSIPVASFLPGLRQENLSQTDYAKWHNSGATALIKGDIRKSGNGYFVDFGLFDISGEKRIALPWKAQETHADKVLDAVYSFVNAVVGYYTGEPGFFGQSMLAVSRDGRGKDARVVSMLTDGTRVSRVTRSTSIEMLPAWGPEGSVLLTSYAKGNPDLYIVRGGKGKRISSHPGMNSGASYCAGNGRIALTLAKDGDAEIYTMAQDGSDLRRLTTNRAIDTSPAWSPDCSKIAFVSDRAGSPQIYIMDANGANLTRLTTIGRYNANPSWNKYGIIAFSARDEMNNLDIYTIRDDGSDLTRITQQQGKNDKPTWSPCGRYIAYSSTRDGASRIYISTADGKSQAPVTTTGWFENPVWGH